MEKEFLANWEHNLGSATLDELRSFIARLIDAAKDEAYDDGLEMGAQMFKNEVESYINEKDWEHLSKPWLEILNAVNDGMEYTD
jgi:hypothetical protein